MLVFSIPVYFFVKNKNKKKQALSVSPADFLFYFF